MQSMFGQYMNQMFYERLKEFVYSYYKKKERKTENGHNSD